MLQYDQPSPSRREATGLSSILPPVTQFQWVEKAHHGNHIFVPRFQCPLCLNWFSLNHPLDHFKREHNLHVTSTVEIPGKFHQAVTAARKRQTLPGGTQTSCPTTLPRTVHSNTNSQHNDSYPAALLRDRDPNSYYRIDFPQSEYAERWQDEEDVTKQLFLVADTSPFAPLSLPMTTAPHDTTTPLKVPSKSFPPLVVSPLRSVPGNTSKPRKRLTLLRTPLNDAKQSISRDGDYPLASSNGRPAWAQRISKRCKKSTDQPSHPPQRQSLIRPPCCGSTQGGRFDDRINDDTPTVQEALQPLWQDILLQLLKETRFSTLSKLLDVRKSRVKQESNEIKKIAQELFQKHTGFSTDYAMMTQCIDRVEHYEKDLEQEINSLRTLLTKLKGVHSQVALQASNTYKLMDLLQTSLTTNSKIIDTLDLDSINKYKSEEDTSTLDFISPVRSGISVYTTIPSSESISTCESMTRDALDSPSKITIPLKLTQITSDHDDSADEAVENILHDAVDNTENNITDEQDDDTVDDIEDDTEYDSEGYGKNDSLKKDPTMHRSTSLLQNDIHALTHVPTVPCIEHKTEITSDDSYSSTFSSSIPLSFENGSSTLMKRPFCKHTP